MYTCFCGFEYSKDKSYRTHLEKDHGQDCSQSSRERTHHRIKQTSFPDSHSKSKEIDKTECDVLEVEY